MTIVPFLRDNVFDAERHPGDVDGARRRLQDPEPVSDKAATERELVAKKIIAFAHQGQRDAALLRDTHVEGDRR